MNDVNYVILIGRLVRDAELKYTNSGLAVSSFAIAVNRSKKQGESWIDEVSFFDIALFGKRAESLNQYLLKGGQIAVEGMLVQDRWENDGQKRSKVRVFCNNVQLLGSRGSNQGGNAGGSQSQSAQPQKDTGGYQGSGSQDGGYSESPSFDDDIPF